MKFYNSNDEGKVRIRFSTTASKIIQDDMSIFSVKSISEFINIVVANFYNEPANKASINHYLEIQESTLKKQLSAAGLDSNTIEHTLRYLIDKEGKTSKKRKKDEIKSARMEVEEELQGYLKQKNTIPSKCYSLRNNVKELLSTLEEADFYYGMSARYVKCTIEVYARLPFIERERIYKKEIYDLLNTAISEKLPLRIDTNAGDQILSFKVFPYKILPNDLHSEDFLACYTIPIDSEHTKRDKGPASFVLSKLTLKTVRIHSRNPSPLCNTDIKALEEAIRVRGIEFLLDDVDDIDVYLTEAGKTLCMTKLAGRPKINILPTQNEYTIRCSTYQAKKYFAKFGKDAIILSPLSLRNEMIEFYKEAIEGYQNYSEE